MAAYSDTLVRYEAERRFVRIFHGRSSYELGVEIGRLVEVNSELREQFFPLREVIAHELDPAQVGYHGMTATDSDLIRRYTGELAGWTRQFAAPLLTNGDHEFDSLSAANAREAGYHRDALRAARLRAKADEAWLRHDLETVIVAYSEIEAELGSGELKRSERARLNYARKKVKDDDR